MSVDVNIWKKCYLEKIKEKTYLKKDCIYCEKENSPEIIFWQFLEFYSAYCVHEHKGYHLCPARFDKWITVVYRPSPGLLNMELQPQGRENLVRHSELLGEAGEVLGNYKTENQHLQVSWLLWQPLKRNVWGETVSDRSPRARPNEPKQWQRCPFTNYNRQESY